MRISDWSSDVCSSDLQDIGWIRCGIMRRGTFPMRAKVWHEHLKTRLGKMRRSAEFDPVYKGAGKQTVQKHKRTSFPDDVKAKPRAILASEPVDPCVS